MDTTQKNQIRGLSKKQFKALRFFCWMSKVLYNVGLYSIRNTIFKRKNILGKRLHSVDQTDTFS
jgi:putative transposase